MAILRRSGMACLLAAKVAACQFGLAVAPVHAQVASVRLAPASEIRLQAAYLLKFPAYITWPEARRAASPTGLVIGIAHGDELFDEAVRIAASLPPHLRPVIRKMQADDALEGVHVLYIGRDADAARYRQWTTQAQQRAVLVVTSENRRPRPGSTINFRVIDERLRFDISLIAAEKAGLKIAAPLLSLAATVIRDNP